MQIPTIETAASLSWYARSPKEMLVELTYLRKCIDRYIAKWKKGDIDRLLFRTVVYDNSPMLVVEFEREETKAEIALRIKAEAAKDAEERELYYRLKAKFDPVN